MGEALNTIVMIDDDIDDIYITKHRLWKARVQSEFLYEEDPARIFDTLAQALSCAEDSSNMIVLLDMNMPGMNGVEALQELREDRRYEDITVFMLCSSDDRRDMLKSYGGGADGYLVKPIDPSEMMGFIDSISDKESNKIMN